jgi:pilus assembly protein Flp/PilA
MVWVREERGQTMAEYGLILALVAVVVIVAITLLGNTLTTFFTDLAGNF